MVDSRHDKLESVTVHLDATKLTITDRRTGRELATKTWPAPIGCPKEISSAESVRDGTPLEAHSEMPRPAMRAWLEAWMKKNATM